MPTSPGRMTSSTSLAMRTAGRSSRGSAASASSRSPSCTLCSGSPFPRETTRGSVRRLARCRSCGRLRSSRRAAIRWGTSSKSSGSSSLQRPSPTSQRTSECPTTSGAPSRARIPPSFRLSLLCSPASARSAQAHPGALWPSCSRSRSRWPSTCAATRASKTGRTRVLTSCTPPPPPCWAARCGATTAPSCRTPPASPRRLASAASSTTSRPRSRTRCTAA
mmetsp:Transcript_32417/g.103732  ORF Transcript_32417/g.103732 Transcript_32417/m.103732 type:complete len:221 (+) Transcript_32417:854-1516(+)